MNSTMIQIRSNGQITLPAAIRRKANLKEGDTLELIVEEDGSLHLSPKIAIDRSQAYFWTKRWQAGEQDAQADIESGKTTRFDDVDDALDFLDSAEE
jgi:AbrB family looped-hinge helix DNA binding protein